MDEIESRIGYQFRNRDLLTTALTHKSFNEGSRKKIQNNEKLEFLGDSVLGLVITEHLYRQLKTREEGYLAKIKSHLVSSDFLFQVAKKLELGRFILLGKGEEKNRGRDNRSIISSTMEALIGAVYLDSNFKIVSTVVLDFFEEFLDPLINKEIRINDYKSELQEIVQKHKNMLPVYRMREESGKPPDTVFHVVAYLENIEIGSGKGKSRREAEQEAAFNALKNIGDFFNYEKLSEVFFSKNIGKDEMKIDEKKTDKNRK
jgi:ribonuclease III